MKTYIKLLLAAVFGLLFVNLCFAQAAVAAAADPVTGLQAAAPADGGLTAGALVQWLTPLLVPLILAAFKKVQPSIPSWVIPLLAPVLGAVIDLVNSLITSHASNLWVAAGLGLAGVGLREVKEAVKPAANGGWPQT